MEKGAAKNIELIGYHDLEGRPAFKIEKQIVLPEMLGRQNLPPDFPYEEGIYIWDVKDPVNPKRLGHFKAGSTGTHRNYWGGGRYVHLAARIRGFEDHIHVIVDIADPSD